MSDRSTSLTRQITIPVADDPEVVNVLVSQTVTRLTEALDDLTHLAGEHQDGAPISAEHVSNLIAIVAGEVLDWLERWPS